MGAKIRKSARVLLTLEEKHPRRLFEGNALLRRLVRIGVLDESKMKLDTSLVFRSKTSSSDDFRRKCSSWDSPSPFTTPGSSSDNATSESASSWSTSPASSSDST